MHTQQTPRNRPSNREDEYLQLVRHGEHDSEESATPAGAREKKQTLDQEILDFVDFGADKGAPWMEVAAHGLVPDLAAVSQAEPVAALGARAAFVRHRLGADADRQLRLSWR